MAMQPQQRVPYSAIVDRPKLTLPDGARLALWTIVNVEEWDSQKAQPRAVLPPPMGQPLTPDLPNWAWHEYGMRVGFWRFVELLARHKIVPTFALNGIVCKNYPRIVQTAKEAGWEFLAHGYVQGPMHKLEDQRAAIRQTIAAIRDYTGTAPRGWESPGLTETNETIDILAEEGIEYVADWVMDDQPFEIQTTKGKVVSIPYTVEVNDVAVIAVGGHGPEEFLRRGRDQFDRLYEEGAASARVMAISIHPYLMGVPHRMKYLEELFAYVTAKPGVQHWTGGEIVDWYKGQRR